MTLAVDARSGRDPLSSLQAAEEGMLIYLPRITADPTTRGYLATYFALWRPPQPVEEAFLSQYQTSGPPSSRRHGDVPAGREWA
jgi:hypothetical protein